ACAAAIRALSLHDALPSFQPMMPVDDDAIVWSAIPCVAEVVGPVAPVRAACSPDATILTRIGHGGVLHVVDALHAADGQPEWLGDRKSTRLNSSHVKISYA